MKAKEKILVVSAGNSLMKDDGLGFVVLEELKKLPFISNVHFFDVGTDIFQLMNIQDHYDKIIILDAIKAGNEPGTIYRLPLENMESLNKNKSVHQIKLTEALLLLKLTNENFDKSEIIFYGIEPYDISLGEGLTAIVQKSIKYLVDLVYEEISYARSYIS